MQGMCTSGLIKAKAVLIQSTEATPRNLRRHGYSMHALVCITVSSVYAFNQRENYKETGDSQKSLWCVEVTATQRGALMNPKSSCIEREERDVSEQSRNSVQCDPISTSRPRESSLDDS